MKSFTPPCFCPFCATRLQIVRKVMGSFYEVMCESEGCERTALVSVDDFVTIQTGTRTAEELP